MNFNNVLLDKHFAPIIENTDTYKIIQYEIGKYTNEAINSIKNHGSRGSERCFSGIFESKN